MKNSIRQFFNWTRLLFFILFVSSVNAQFHQHTLQTIIHKPITAKYLVYTPTEYHATDSRSWPLLLYLHGGSLRGDDIRQVAKLGLPNQLENGLHIPFIVVVPQCPNGEIWTDTDGLIAILNEVERHYSVDKQRVYLTGHSMGGRGTWYLAYKHPERFAAIIPVAGLSPIQAWADRLRPVPVWAIYGDKDVIVPLADSEGMVKAITQAGGQARLTVLPNRDHFILDVYERPDIYTWLLRHRRHDR